MRHSLVILITDVRSRLKHNKYGAISMIAVASGFNWTQTVSAAKAGIGKYLEFYNARRPHSALDAMTPDEFYYQNLLALKQAA